LIFHVVEGRKVYGNKHIVIRKLRNASFFYFSDKNIAGFFPDNHGLKQLLHHIFLTIIKDYTFSKWDYVLAEMFYEIILPDSLVY